MAFCCCKKSKHVEENEGKELQTGLLGQHHEEEQHDQPTTSATKPEPLAAMQVTGVVDIGEKHATGVAKLSGSIYILCKNPSSILIHRDQSPFDCTGEISLKDLEAPWDLASSVKSSCLYLTDCTSNSVYKMTLPSHEVSPWLKDISYPHTLTVTSPEDQVLLLRYGSPASLEIYGTDAVEPVKVRSIQLPDEIEYPKHAVPTSDGNYVVSGKAKGREEWGVFEMNVEGKILHRLTQGKHVTESYHLAIDSADRLFVADCWNHRLLILDAELNRSEELQAKDGKALRWPWRLHYVTSDNQVLVLQHDGKVVRGVKNGENDAAEEKTKDTAGEDGIATAEDKKTEKDEEKIEEEKTQDDDEKETEKATADEKKEDKEEDEEKAIANGKMTEKTEDEDKKKGEEEDEKKAGEKEEKERKVDHGVVYIYSYI